MNSRRPNTAKSSVFVRSVIGKSLPEVVQELLDLIGWTQLVPPRGFVAIKPNFCEYRSERIHDANTSFEVLEAVCAVLSSRASRISIVESDGLRYKIDDVFNKLGLERLRNRYGVELINLSEDKGIVFSEPLLEGFKLPAILTECDCLISVPKLKTHALTYFTGALKNQWGCIPREDRILLHKHLSLLIPRLNKLLSPRMALMDGLTAMEGRGPTNGIPRKLDLLLASTDLVALDATAMRLAGLTPEKARHALEAAAIGVGNIDESEIHVDADGLQISPPLIPAKQEWTLELMNYFTRYPAFVRHILLNNGLFVTAKGAVSVLRRWGLS